MFLCLRSNGEIDGLPGLRKTNQVHLPFQPHLVVVAARCSHDGPVDRPRRQWDCCSPTCSVHSLCNSGAWYCVQKALSWYLVHWNTLSVSELHFPTFTPIRSATVPPLSFFL